MAGLVQLHEALALALPLALGLGLELDVQQVLVQQREQELP